MLHIHCWLITNFLPIQDIDTIVPALAYCQIIHRDLTTSLDPINKFIIFGMYSHTR